MKNDEPISSTDPAECLRESEERFKLTFEQSPIGIAFVSLDRHFIRANKAFCSMLGYTEKELISLRFMDVTHPDDLRADIEPVKQLAAGKIERYVADKRYVRKDGGIVWGHLSVAAIQNASGHPLYFMPMIEDITDRKREEKTREAERNLMHLCHSADNVRELARNLALYFQHVTGCEAIGIRLRNGDDFPYYETRGFSGEFVQAENRLCPEDEKGQPIRDSADNPALKCMCGNILRGRVDPTKPFFTRYGSFWSSCTSELPAGTTEADRQTRACNRCNGEGYESVALIPLRSQEKILGLFQFNDKRKGLFTLKEIEDLERLADYVALTLTQLNTEKTLHDSEIKYRTLFENMVQGAFYQQADGLLIDANPAALDLFGLTRDEFLKRTSYDPHWKVIGEDGSVIPPEQHPSMVALKTGKSLKDAIVAVYNSRTDSYKWVCINATPEFKPGEDAPYQVFVTLHDITKRKKAEEALRESTAFLDTIVENIPNMIFIKDAQELRFVRFNKAGEELLGQSRNDLIGKNDYDFFPLEQADFFVAKDRDVLASKSMLDIPEEPLQTKNRGVRFLHTKKLPIMDKDGKPLYLLGISEDVTERKSAEEAMRETEEWFRVLVDNMLDSALIMDWDGRALFANRAALRLAELDPSASAENLNVMNFVHPNSRAALATDMGIIRKTGGRFLAEYRMQLRSNTDKWVEALGIKIHYKGAEAGLVTLRDITERKRMAEALWESQERYRVLFAEMLNGFVLFQIILDENDRPLESALLAVNPAFERMTGLSASAVLGKSIYEVLPKSLWIGTYEEMAITGKPAHFETISQAFNKCYAVTAFSPKKGQCAMIFEDVTERKHAEDVIRNLNEELEKRVIERTVELEAANRELNAFSYSVSHDLRAPLRAIGGFSRILKEEYAGQLPAEARRYIERVEDNARHMGRLVDDLLSFSRLGRQPLQTQTISIAPIVREALDRLKPDYEGRTVEIAMGELPPCDADPSLLRHVFTNLLSNAIKFTRKQPAARIEIGCHPEADELVFFVKDNGSGFDMRYADKLFGVFQRLHRTEDFEGTGVGLAIVQRIIHRHGGRIWAQAEVGRGATFFFTLKTEARV